MNLAPIAFASGVLLAGYGVLLLFSLKEPNYPAPLSTPKRANGSASMIRHE